MRTSRFGSLVATWDEAVVARRGSVIAFDSCILDLQPILRETVGDLGSS